LDDVQRMLIERACARLQTLYAEYADLGEYHRVAEVFAPDATLELGPDPLVGEAAIRARFPAWTDESARPVQRHVITNQSITVLDDRTAEGYAYVAYYRGDDGDALPRHFDGPRLLGLYRDRFVLTDAGWRIAHRRMEVALRA
jgi:hypothetical protein